MAGTCVRLIPRKQGHELTGQSTKILTETHTRSSALSSSLVSKVDTSEPTSTPPDDQDNKAEQSQSLLALLIIPILLGVFVVVAITVWRKKRARKSRQAVLSAEYNAAPLDSTIEFKRWSKGSFTSATPPQGQVLDVERAMMKDTKAQDVGIGLTADLKSETSSVSILAST